MRKGQWKRWGVGLAAALVLFVLCFWLLQRYWAHREGYFVPDYPRVTLSQDSDYKTIFQQTGLGRPAVDRLLAEGDFQAVLDAQDAFFAPPPAVCAPLLGWFTREDRLEGNGVPLADLQPGDIVLTLSTHTAGWRHGHAGLAIDGDTTLECEMLGTDSVLADASRWSTYSTCAVLRLKAMTPELQEQIVEFGMKELLGVPYRLTAGLIGEKAPEPETSGFGLHCSYLVWYAFYRFGYDLDSDGGRLVSAYDLLHSDLLEVVQVWGMDPRKFKVL